MEIANQVRLYAANALDVDAATLARYSTHLDSAEAARAARFVFEKHRRRFIAAHGFMREVLARELELAPGSLVFEFGRNGKPRVTAAAVHFSLTHTAEYALLAVSERELGLDAEEVRPARVEAALAGRVMTAQEFGTWSRAAREAQVSAFFRLWSAKECVMKACGQGMELGPGSFSVFAPGTLEVAGSVLVEGREWTLRTLQSPPAFALALATDGEAKLARMGWT